MLWSYSRCLANILTALNRRFDLDWWFSLLSLKCSKPVPDHFISHNPQLCWSLPHCIPDLFDVIENFEQNPKLFITGEGEWERKNGSRKVGWSGIMNVHKMHAKKACKIARCGLWICFWVLLQQTQKECVNYLRDSQCS